LTLLLLLGGGVFWWVGRLTPSKAVATNAEKSIQATTPSSGVSIGVLPFVDMSQGKDQAYFADGISEELLNVLARVKGLGVASRTSSFAYKNSELRVADIAQALKVNHILEGSVRKAGGRVRITAQLIDAVNDRQLWSETYDRELTDIFAIQEDIANSIVTALQGALGTTGASGPPVNVHADTGNLEAYDLYLKARELFIARRDLPESIRLFERVTAMDAKFARGWEGLAAVYSVAPVWGIRDRDYLRLAKAAAQRALQLDPSLSMPSAALANFEEYQLPIDFARSLEFYNRALAADPRNSTALLWRSIDWANLGFFDRALADQDRCLAIDPAYKNCTRWKALTLLLAGKADQGLALFEQGVAEGFVTNRSESFIPLLLRRGDRVGAILLMKELGANAELSAILLAHLSNPRPLSAADASIVSRALTDHDSLFSVRMSAPRVDLWLGHYDRIPTAADLNIDTIAHWEPGFPAFHRSPAFRAVLERLGVARYWREHGYPPQCRSTKASDFTCP